MCKCSKFSVADPDRPDILRFFFFFKLTGNCNTYFDLGSAYEIKTHPYGRFHNLTFTVRNISDKENLAESGH